MAVTVQCSGHFITCTSLAWQGTQHCTWQSPASVEHSSLV